MRTQLVDGLFADLLQVVRFLRVYADDTSVIVHSDESLRSLFSLLERYEQASGAKLNVSKSHGLLFGTWKYRADLPVQLDWSSEAITVLGCRIANEESVHWDSLIIKFESQLTLWQQRQFLFRGWALVANVLGLSLFWYQATVFDMPKTVIFKINKILFPFVWGKKRVDGLHFCHPAVTSRRTWRC